MFVQGLSGTFSGEVMSLAGCLEENSRERTFKLLPEGNKPVCKFPEARQSGACLRNSKEFHMHVEEEFLLFV